MRSWIKTVDGVAHTRCAPHAYRRPLLFLHLATGIFRLANNGLMARTRASANRAI